MCVSAPHAHTSRSTRAAGATATPSATLTLRACPAVMGLYSSTARAGQATGVTGTASATRSTRATPPPCQHQVEPPPPPPHHNTRACSSLSCPSTFHSPTHSAPPPATPHLFHILSTLLATPFEFSLPRTTRCLRCLRQPDCALRTLAPFSVTTVVPSKPAGTFANR